MYKVGQDITWDSRLKQKRVRQVRQVGFLSLQNWCIRFEKQNFAGFDGSSRLFAGGGHGAGWKPPIAQGEHAGL